MNLLRLSLNLLRRDWRAGEWRVLLLALVLAVGSLATVGMFADRVRQALQQEATSLIGADLRITSTRPLPSLYRSSAEARGLRAVESRSFPSMVSSREQALLSEIQAVEEGYPLRGKIEVDDAEVGRDSSRQAASSVGMNPDLRGSSIPMPGTVWADDRLLRRLDLQVGDEVGIGAMRFIVAARVVKDIDQSIGFSSFAPRVLMNAQDLVATDLLQEGSRITYRLMVAGEAVQVAALRAELEAKLTGNEKLEDVRDARPEIRSALERAEHFLGLAALTAAILAGAAILLAARRFVQRHLDGCAVMRCLGAQQGQVLRLFLYQFLLLGFFAVLAGCLLGYVTQALLISLIETMRDAALPQPSLLPAVKAAISGFALLLGFGFLPLLQLRRVSPLRVLRRELGAPQPNTVLAYLLAMAVLAALFLWHSGSAKLGLAMLGGLLAGLAVFGALAWLTLHGLARYFPYLGSHWRHAVNNLVRHGRSNALQVVALALGGMALLLLTLVRADLLQGWQDRLPPDTPNRFVVNIQPHQQQAMTDFFAREKLPPPELQPMVRGRLVAINDRPVSGDSYADSRASRLVEREFNLSYMEQMPEWNKLVSGVWWTSPVTTETSHRRKPVSSSLETLDSGLPAGQPVLSLTKGRNDEISEERKQLSVEEGIAETLGIHLGDTLTYDVAGSRFTARVTSLREVEWDSMRVNFFVIATPELLRDFPASYLTSFYLPPDRARAGDLLAREFPNVLVIDTGSIIDQVRHIMDQITQVMGAVFMFTLLSGFAVLYAALLATQDERRFEAAVLRTLGADGRYLRRLHLSEFAVLGGLSGLFAAAGAVLLGWVLALRVLEIPYQPNAAIWFIGVLGGMAAVMLAGWAGTRRLAALPPLAILRE
ncbi:MAG: FtsX-like permease family protein [Gallionella sp.]|jgi:putative ABC transport system permease protein|nr:FtsX-like permease family protein [Gallionella sp.]MCK9353342.1 FtsX-like permease family protein [Gallionella sp.]